MFCSLPVVKYNAPLFKFQPSSVSENQVNQQKQMIPSERDKPAGLQLSDFLPVSGL